MKMAVFMDNSLPNLILSTKRGTFMDRCLQTMHLRSFKELDRTRPSAFCRYLYRTVPNISHFTAFSGLSFTKMLEKLPDGQTRRRNMSRKSGKDFSTQVSSSITIGLSAPREATFRAITIRWS